MHRHILLFILALAGFASLSARLQTAPVRIRPNHHTHRLPGVNEHRLERLEKMRRQNVARRNLKGPYRASAMSGKKKGLVLLVQFSDYPMQSGAKAAWETRFNLKGFGLDHHVGSVRDYFIEQSYGMLTIDFDIVGPLTLSRNHDYYGTAPNSNLDDRAAEMVIEALRLADGEVNYADYDWDGDGEVEQVYAIYAGPTDSDKVGKGYIWPHEWDFYSSQYFGVGAGPQQLDGVLLNTYAVSNEMVNSTTTEGIGTACHEFSHCLGYPDFYDTGYAGGTACQEWDLLDAGSYNGPYSHGEVPSPFTAYERWVAGWMDLTPLTEPVKVSGMPAINEEGVAYVIRNSGNVNEYYILENRQCVTFGTYNYGHGLMVWHVDYSLTAWQQNTVNALKDHQRMTYLPADGKVGTLSTVNGYTSYYTTPADLRGDPYPGSKNVTAVAPLVWYTAERGGDKTHQHLIHGIKESADGKMSFIYGDYAALPAPEPLAATDVFREQFTANWLPVEGAESYNLNLTALTGTALPVTVLEEDFSGFAQAGKDSSVGGSVVNAYTAQPGWTVSGCYGTAASSVRLGSAKQVGSITTPALANKAGTLQVDFEAAYYGNDGSSVIVSILDGSERVLQTTMALTATATPCTCTFSGVPEGCKVQFATVAKSERLYLYNVKITDVTDAGTVVTVHEGLTGTSFTVSPAIALQYVYSVQAVGEDGKSEWSPWVDVDLSTATGIDRLPVQEKRDAEVYDLCGRRLQAVPARGLYLQGGKVRLAR